MSIANQPQVIATVVSVSGMAFARNADGAVRRLTAGDIILEGEIVFTLADGQVELAFSDGHHTTILPSESYLLGPEAMIATSPSSGDAAIQAAGEVGKVVQALEGNGDILEELDPTAAGAAAAGNHGHSFVRLLRITEPLTPVGYEFPLNPFGNIHAPAFEGIPGENGKPTAGISDATLDDEGLGGIAGGTGDVAGEASSISGILAFDFGPDGVGDINFAAMNGISGSLGTETVTYSWDDNTNTLTASSGRGDVFTVTVDPATGNYVVNLLLPVMHSPGGDENDASVALTFTVVDGNGDSADGTFTLTIDDDTPVATNDGQLAALDDNASGVTIGTVAGLLSNDNYGADGQAASDAITIGAGSLGGTVAIVGGSLVYTSATNLAPGASADETFTYTITDADGDPATATFTVHLTDTGPAINEAAAAILADEDDIAAAPAGNPAGDNDLTTPSTSGTLAGLSFGGDGPGDITLGTSGNIGFNTLAGNPVETVWDGTSHTLTGRDSVTQAAVFTLQITDVSTGAYAFNLLAPVQHTVSGTEDDKTFNVDVTVTDVEGDPAVGSISILINDDTPIASDLADGGTYAEGSTGNVVAADAVSALGISAGEDGLQGTLQDIVFTGGQGNLFINGSGQLIYDAPASVLNQNGPVETTFSYTVTDSDGDPVTKTVTVSISDTGIINPRATNTNELVDEDDIAAAPAGNPGGDGDLAPLTTGQINFTLGQDALQSITLSVASTGLTKLDGVTQVNTSWDANTNTLTGYGGADTSDVVFTIVLSNFTNSGADYDVTLYQPVKHPGHDNPGTQAIETSFEDNLGFAVNVTILDADNSLASTSFLVAINDDTPVANNYAGSTYTEGSGAHDLGNAVSLLGISAGEDGLQGTLQDIVFSNQGVTGGTLAIDGSGNLIYTSPASWSGPNGIETFSYTVTDGDGDAVTKQVTFGVSDSGVSGVSATNEVVDEDDIAAAPAGNPGGDGDVAPVTTGHINFTLGQDPLQSITLSTAGGTTSLKTLDNVAVDTTFVANGTGGTLIGFVHGTDSGDSANWVFKVELNNITSSGADYDTTLYQPVMHPGHDADGLNNGPQTAWEDSLGVTINVSVKDADNSTGSSSFQVSINDDTPVASDFSGSTYVEGSGAHDLGNAVSLLGISAGEDGLQGTLQDIVFSNQGATGGTLAIDGSGNLIYTSPTSVDNSVPVTETFNYTVTDRDGDAVTKQVTFGVSDTGVTDLRASNEVVDEDDITAAPAGNPGGDGDLAPVTTGHIYFTLGQDALQSVALSVADTGLTKLDGVTHVNTSWDANSNTLTGYGGADTSDVVFTIVLNNITSSGADYDVTLYQPVSHPGHDADSLNDGPQTAWEDTLSFTVDVSVKDTDNSEGTTSFQVSINDDTPIASDYTGGLYSEGSGAHTIGNAVTLLGISAGEDGLQGTLQDIVFTNQGATGGTLAIDGSGNLVYTSPASVSEDTTETFSYTVTDRDGDAVTKQVTFDVNNTGITDLRTTDTLVDEDDLPVVGNNDSAPGDDTPVSTGHIYYTLGQTPLQSIALAEGDTGLTKLDGITHVNTSWDANTNTLTGYGGADTSDVVFTIVLSNISDTGTDYDVTLYQPVKHPGQDDPSTNPTPVETLFEDNLSFSVGVTVTDADNSVGNTSFLVTIDDDTPILSVTADEGASQSLAVELDETVGTDRANSSGETANGNPDDAGPGLAQVTTDVQDGLVSLFGLGGSYGADGPGTTTGNLSFVGIPAEGLATTLSSTAGGAITLYLESGAIVGRDANGGDPVFTIEIVDVGGGVYQLQTTLYEALNHGNDANLFDATLNLLLGSQADGTVQLQYEVTRVDADGDSVTQADQIDLISSDASVFAFGDDGPILGVNAVQGAAQSLAVELDETVGTDRANSPTETANGNTDDAGPGLAQVTTAVQGGLENLFGLTGDYGSDGPGSTTGNLSFVGVPAEGLATTLSSTAGGAITLYLESGAIVGRDANGGDPVFTIEIVDVGGGVYQLQTTLYEALNHGNEENPALFDETVNLVLAQVDAQVQPLVQLQYEVTREDADGDSVTQADQIDLISVESSVFTFGDDGPAINTLAVNVTGEITIDETAGVQTDGSKDDISTASLPAAFAAIVATPIGAAQDTAAVAGLTGAASYGSDGPATSNATAVNGYSLTDSLGAAFNGDATGLQVTNGNAISLYTEGNLVVGREAGTNAVAFALYIDSNGDVTMAQYKAIDHGDGSGNESAPTGADEVASLANLVYVTASVTVTDGDGDQVSSNLTSANDLVVNFYDDGPAINTLAVNVTGEITIDETSGVQTDGSKDDISTASLPAAFAAIVATPIGAAQDTAAVAGLSGAAAYGTDGAGSTAVNGYSLTDSLGAAFNGDATGLQVTNGNAISLYTEGNLVVGREAGTNAVAFALYIDSNGDVTMAQYKAIDHGDGSGNESAPTGADEVASLANLVYVTASVTVTDGDGDQVSSNLTSANDLVVNFYDDGPSFFVPDEIHLIDQATAPDVTRELNFSGLTGTDGLGNVVFQIVEGSPAKDQAGNSLSFNGAPLFLYYGVDHGVIIASTSATAGGVDINNVSTTGFWINIDPVADTYTMHSNGVIENGTGVTATESDIISAGHVPFVVLTDLGTTTQDAIITGSDDINTNASLLGIGNGQNFTYTDATTYDGVRIDFVNGAQFIPNGGGTSDDEYSYDTGPASHNLTTAYHQDVYVSGGSTNSANIRITAIVADDDNAMYAVPPGDTGETKIVLSATNIEVYDGTTLKVQGTDYTVDASDPYSVTLNGLKDGWTFVVTTDSANKFDAIQLDAASGSDAYKLSLFTYGESYAGDPVDLEYTIVGTDGDGDSVNSAIHATLYPDSGQTIAGGAGNETLTGDSHVNYILGDGGDDTLYGLGNNDVLVGDVGNDHLYGGDGSDTLLGGPGNDFLEGGTGSDTFVWHLADRGSTATPAVDTIMDFSKAEGDILNLADLLQNESSGTLSSYLSFTEESGNAVLNVSSTGSGVDQKIVFDNWSLADLQTEFGASSAADLITKMHANGNLVTD
jgi:hypothetical protein